MKNVNNENKSDSLGIEPIRLDKTHFYNASNASNASNI